MLSKILTGAAGETATHLTWPSAGGAAPALRLTPSGVLAGGDTGDDDARQAPRIAELEKQAERRIREARTAGYGEGETAGRVQAAAEVQQVIEKLARSIQEIAALRPCLMRESAAELLELAVGIARRILHREIALDSGALESLVGGALHKLTGQEILRVRIHPALETGVRQALGHEGRGTVPLIADGTLERGAILIELARGKLDASVETQLAEIGRGLADRLPPK